jgi:hypothetical protein
MTFLNAVKNMLVCKLLACVQPQDYLSLRIGREKLVRSRGFPLKPGNVCDWSVAKYSCLTIIYAKRQIKF